MSDLARHAGACQLLSLLLFNIHLSCGYEFSLIGPWFWHKISTTFQSSHLFKLNSTNNKPVYLYLSCPPSPSQPPPSTCTALIDRFSSIKLIKLLNWLIILGLRIVDESQFRTDWAGGMIKWTVESSQAAKLSRHEERQAKQPLVVVWRHVHEGGTTRATATTHTATDNVKLGSSLSKHQSSC